MGHLTKEELDKKLVAASKLVKVGGLYSHYKHSEQKYILEFLGFLEATEEVCVGYRALYDSGTLWIRPLSNFLEEVEVEGKKVKRFVDLN